MVFLLQISVLFRRPLTFFIVVGGDELQVTHNRLMSPQGLHLSAHSTAKTIIKAQISGRMSSIGISDVVTASVYLEKPV